MDYTMPDGVVVRNVPLGMTQQEVERRYMRSRGGGSAPQAPTPAPQAPAPPLELPTKTLRDKAAAEYATSTYMPASGKVEDMNPALQGVIGFKAAVDNAALGAKGLFTNLSPEDKKLLAQGRAFLDAAGPGATIGNIGGTVFSTAPFAGPLGTGARAVAGAVLPRTLGNVAGTVAADAAVGAAVSPENRLAGAEGGAVGSVFGQTAQQASRGLVAPWVRPEARELMERYGVQPTVGQSVGGVVNSLEQKASSFVPGVRRARDRAVDEWGNATNQSVLPRDRRMTLPDGGVGDRAVLTTHDRVRDMYNRAFDAFPPEFTVDHGQVANMALLATQRPGLVLSPQGVERVMQEVQNSILAHGPTLTPEMAKQIEANLNQAVRNTLHSADGETRAVGQTLLDIRNAWHQSLGDIGDAGGRWGGTLLREADQSYRAFLPVDSAAASAVAQNQAVTSEAGRYTPRLLRRAIERVDRSQNNRQSRRVAAGMDPYEPAPRAPGEQPQVDPIVRRGQPTPWGETPGTDVVPQGFDFGGGGQLAPAGGAGSGQIGPVRAGGARAPRPGYVMDTDLPGGGATPSRFDEVNRLTRLGEVVTPDYVPDSGTAGRLGVWGIPAAAAKLGGIPGVVGAGLGLGAAALGSTRRGQQFLTQGFGPVGQTFWGGYAPGALYGAGVNAGRDLGGPTPQDDERLLRSLMNVR